MESLRLFFELNRDLVFFLYGLTFFVLGLAIALQSRHFSRLDIARSFTWLAAFGFTHGLHEWGEYFIPIQAIYLSEGTIELLHFLRLLLLAVSFACLFEFGVRLLRPLGQARILHRMPAVLLSAWILVGLLLLPGRIREPEIWHNLADAGARYFIGFPGGLVAAIGLRRHTYERITRFDAPHIARSMRFVGVTLGLYALLGGLIVPPISFFPGNLINTVSFEQLLIAPAPVLRSIIGLMLAISTIRALEVFDLEIVRRIEAMEQQQILAAERNRIARELHDGAIQQVYSAGLLVESAFKLTQPQDPIAARLKRAVGALDEAIGDLRRSLQGLQSVPSSTHLPERLRELVRDAPFGSMIDVELEVNLPETESIAPYRADHVVAILNEALSNVLRHAKASKITIRADQNDGWLNLRIQDNGVGLPRKYEAGYGLRNMRDRARLLSGELTVESTVGQGTLVDLLVPWSEET